MKRKFDFSVDAGPPIFSSSPNSSLQRPVFAAAKRRAITSKMSSKPIDKENEDTEETQHDDSPGDGEGSAMDKTVLMEIRAMRKENAQRYKELKTDIRGLREDYASGLQKLEEKCNEREDVWQQKWQTMESNFCKLKARVEEPSDQLQGEIFTRVREELLQKVSAEIDVKSLLQEAQENARKLNDLVEREAKRQIRKNIIIKGAIPAVITEGNVFDGANRYIAELFGIDDSVESAFIIGKGSGAGMVKITLKSMEIKKIILKAKSAYLKGTKTFIQNDLTVKESNSAKIILKIAKEKRANKIEVKVAGANIYMEDKWWTWNDRTQQLSPAKQMPYQARPDPVTKQTSPHHSPMEQSDTTQSQHFPSKNASRPSSGTAKASGTSNSRVNK